MMLRRSFKGSGIDTRHSVCNRFFSGDLYDSSARASTGERNRRFIREARELSRQVGERLLDHPGSPGPEEITHLVFASCTGFSNPGSDFHLIGDLGLRPDTQRYVLGSMGCYSGVPALRLAGEICDARPSAKVLVIVTELCSLHLKLDSTYDSILANCLFGDGAAGAIVSRDEGPARFGEFFTGIVPEGEPDMSWQIGDQGFDLVLSNRVPQILESEVGAFIRAIAEPESIEHWAVHPGGRGIVDAVEKSVPLPPEKLIISRDILRRFGNMAGATILFVMKDIMESVDSGSPESLMAISFGPGLTVEAGLFDIKNL